MAQWITRIIKCIPLIGEAENFIHPNSGETIDKKMNSNKSPYKYFKYKTFAK